MPLKKLNAKSFMIFVGVTVSSFVVLALFQNCGEPFEPSQIVGNDEDTTSISGDSEIGSLKDNVLSDNPLESIGDLSKLQAQLIPPSKPEFGFARAADQKGMISLRLDSIPHFGARNLYAIFGEDLIGVPDVAEPKPNEKPLRILGLSLTIKCVSANCSELVGQTIASSKQLSAQNTVGEFTALVSNFAYKVSKEFSGVYGTATIDGKSIRTLKGGKVGLRLAYGGPGYSKSIGESQLAIKVIAVSLEEVVVEFNGLRANGSLLPPVRRSFKPIRNPEGTTDQFITRFNVGQDSAIDPNLTVPEIPVPSPANCEVVNVTGDLWDKLTGCPQTSIYTGSSPKSATGHPWKDSAPAVFGTSTATIQATTNTNFEGLDSLFYRIKDFSAGTILGFRLLRVHFGKITFENFKSLEGRTLTLSFDKNGNMSGPIDLGFGDGSKLNSVHLSEEIRVVSEFESDLLNIKQLLPLSNQFNVLEFKNRYPLELSRQIKLVSGTIKFLQVEDSGYNIRLELAAKQNGVDKFINAELKEHW